MNECGAIKEETGGCRCILHRAHHGSCSCGAFHLKPCSRNINHPKFDVPCENWEVAICPRPCTRELPCHHQCPGSCGECVVPSNWIGSIDQVYLIHRRCTNHCGRLLPCGHLCEDGCGEACSPCHHLCDFDCGHEKCQGDHPCYKCRRGQCTEPCVWRCPHFRCELPCHVPCTRPRCDERCSKALACGHPCCGVCGEPCPLFCPACYRGEGGEAARNFQREEAKKIVVDLFVLFDEESVEELCRGEMTDEPAARLLYLQCCKRYVCVGFMDGAVKALEENPDRELVLMKCLYCKARLLPARLRRYSSLLKLMIQDHGEITKRKIAERETLYDNNQKAVTQLFNVLRLGPGRTNQELNAPHSALQAYWKHFHLREQEEARSNRFAGVPSPALVQWKTTALQRRRQLEDELMQSRSPVRQHKHFELLVQWCLNADLKQRSVSFSVPAWHQCLTLLPLPRNQPLRVTYLHETITAFSVYLLKHHFHDMEDVIALRFALVVDWLCSLFMIFIKGDVQHKALCNAAHRNFFFRDHLPPPSRFNQLAVDDRQLEQLAEKGRRLAEHFNPVNISELLQLRGALNLTSGHFYKCTCGFIYLITECGRPMQEFRCPECQRTLGGRNHNLTSTSTQIQNL